MPIPELPKVQPVIPDGYVFIAITRRDPDLPVAIMGWPTKRRDVTDGPAYNYPVTAAAVEARCQTEGLDMVSWRIIRYQDIPDDRLYREAWEDVGVIAHNIPKARNIHREHIRVQRAIKMAELDTAYMRADEANNTQEKKRISDKKQVLRDLPSHPSIDAAQSIAELKAFWPDDLL